MEVVCNRQIFNLCECFRNGYIGKAVRIVGKHIRPLFYDACLQLIKIGRNFYFANNTAVGFLGCRQANKYPIISTCLQSLTGWQLFKQIVRLSVGDPSPNAFRVVGNVIFQRDSKFILTGIDMGLKLNLQFRIFFGCSNRYVCIQIGSSGTRLGNQGHSLRCRTNCVIGRVESNAGLSVAFGCLRIQIDRLSVPLNNFVTRRHCNFYTELCAVRQLEALGVRMLFFDSTLDYNNRDCCTCRNLFNGGNDNVVVIDDPMCVERNFAAIFIVNDPRLIALICNNFTVNNLDRNILRACSIRRTPIAAKGVSDLLRKDKVIGDCNRLTIFNIGNAIRKACSSTLTVKHYSVGFTLPLCGKLDALGVERSCNLISVTINFGKSVILDFVAVFIGNLPTDKLPTYANGIINGNALVVFIHGKLSTGCKIAAVTYRNIGTQIVFDGNVDGIPLRNQANFIITVFICFGSVNSVKVFPRFRVLIVPGKLRT